MMKKVFWAISILGLALTIVPAILVFTGQIDNAENKQLMLVGMLLWFAGRWWEGGE